MPASGRRAQGLGLAQQLQERPDGVVLVDQRRAQGRLDRAVVVGDELVDLFQRGQDLLLARPGFGDDGRPQRRWVQVGARLGDRVELLNQHPARPGQEPGGFLQLRQHRQPVARGLAARRRDQPRGYQQREQIEGVVDRLGLQ
ncbi:hypothetical protein [Nonomuraea sp. NPDC001699]